MIGELRDLHSSRVVRMSAWATERRRRVFSKVLVVSGYALVLAFAAGMNRANAQSIVDALQGGAVFRVQHTDCHLGAIKNPVILTILLSYRDGKIIYQSLGSPGHYDPWLLAIPVNGTSGAFTSSVTNSSVTISGPSTAVFSLSPGGDSCTYNLSCPQNRNRQIISCSVQSQGVATADATKSGSVSNAPQKSGGTTGQSASCSDITGTSSAEPAAKHCKNAEAQLHGARINKTKIPGYAQEQYKAAATAFRLAGDNARALLVETEATEPDPEPIRAIERELERRKKLADDAQFALKIARKTEVGAYKDQNCSDLRIAADQYQEAGEAFLKSNEVPRANQMYQRRNELVEIVNRARRSGACDGTARPKPQAPVSKEVTFPSIPAADCKNMYDNLEQTIKRLSQRERNDETWINRTMVELAARGCANPNGKRDVNSLFWRYACISAIAHWEGDKVPSGEIVARAKRAECPSGLHKHVPR